MTPAILPTAQDNGFDGGYGDRIGPILPDRPYCAAVVDAQSGTSGWPSKDIHGPSAETSLWVECNAMTSKWSGGVGIVEDEPTLAGLIAEVLAANRIPVSFVACDGDEAVEKFRKSIPKPEVIIMDYRLPASNGIAVMKEMRQHPVGDPEFVFLSADSRIMEEALRAGASEFLVKPASMRNLVKAVEHAAEK